jgi:hypothetical protein
MDNAIAFMDASITTGNPVYRASTAVITFTDDFSALPAAGSGDGSSRCWMIDHEVSTGTTVTSCSRS